MQPISKNNCENRTLKPMLLLVAVAAALSLVVACSPVPTSGTAGTAATEETAGMSGDIPAAQPIPAEPGQAPAGMPGEAGWPATGMMEPETGPTSDTAGQAPTGGSSAGDEDQGLGIMIVNQPRRGPPPVRGKLLGSGARVYSNTDLPSIEESDPGAALNAEADTSDQTAAFGEAWQAQRNESQTAAQQTAQRMNEVDTRVSQLQAELDQLTQEENSLHNPLAYPRSKVQKSEGERSADSGLDVAARLDQISQRRAAIQAEIEKERARLNEPSQ